MHHHFDKQVIRALEKWPNVPACYGWLRLNRRGRWLIQGQSISHSGAIKFLSRNYGCDEHGRWFVQNGPQRAYCDLDYTPWVYHLDGSDQLFTHTEKHALELRCVVVDDGGDILIETECGIGLLEDRDLARFIELMGRQTSGDVVGDYLAAHLANLGDKSCDSVEIFWDGRPIVMQAMKVADVPAAFGYVATPVDIDG